MPRRAIRITLIAGLPVLLAIAAFLLIRDTYQPFGTLLLNPRPAEATQFSLTAHDGSTRSLSDFRGKVVLIFFGFINCPDLCPTTMLELGKVYRALTPSEQERVQVLLITVDPKRDSKELLREYTTFFGSTFLGMTGSLDQIAEVARKFGVFFQKTAIESPTDYFVDHTTAVFAIDPQGQLRLVYGSGRVAQTDRVVEDVRWLLRN